MILRVFRSQPRAGKGDDFAAFLKAGPMKTIPTLDGFLGQHVGRSDEGSFVYITIWQDEHALQGFAGEDWTVATIPTEEADLLEHVAVDHYSELAAE